MAESSIKVQIAGRTYPLSIEKSKEALVEKALELIGKKIKDNESAYVSRDKQDLLAMSCLQLVVELIELENKVSAENTQVAAKLQEMSKKLADHLAETK